MKSTTPQSTSVLPAALVVIFQVVACGFFLADALSDQSDRSAAGGGSIEIIVAFGLLAGIVLGAMHIAQQAREIRLRASALAMARGALSRLLVDRFAQWKLSAAEADVALFALKGCTIAEIASLRSAAQGTVRAQLSQVYAKAGVSSQPMLMSLFLDELMDGEGLVPEFPANGAI